VSEPTYTCEACQRVVVVQPDGRGFPPDIAKRKLIRACKAAGHKAEPKYMAGLVFGRGVVGQ
jgi:hypothetical protein